MPHLQYDDDELGLEPGWDEGLDPNIRRELKQARVARKELDEARTQLATYEKERVLSRAGIPQDKRGDLFARTYEGPTDDPGAVKAAWEELFGPVGEPAGDPAAGDKRIADAAAAGTSQGTPGTVDLADAIRAAKTNEEVLEIVRNAPPEAKIRLPED